MRVLLELNGEPEGLCSDCITGTGHPLVLWEIERKPKPWGHFATVTINGESHVIDASLPHKVDQLPRDAKQVEADLAERYWHEDNESHVFGGPNVAKALREAIR